MLKQTSTTSPSRTRPILWATAFILAATIYLSRHLLYTSWTLASLQMLWRTGADGFVLSEANDNFDITFANYTNDQVSAAPYEDVIPPVLHYISLGKHGAHWREEWIETVQSCRDFHPGWDVHVWTDDNAASFVAERFPEMKAMWDNYRYPIERIDALRYMVLYEYGGAVLDMDLKCKRALGPLRRFEFVAPEAHPTGFSIGFMMASKHNSFMRDLVRNLTVYDHHWLGLPYSTVMFSTGCHFASVIHAYEDDRTKLKILPGPLHSLNGRVSTPIFEHLGSSSWHSYDAQLIVTLGHAKLNIVFYVSMGIALALVLRRRWLRRRSWKAVLN